MTSKRKLEVFEGVQGSADPPKRARNGAKPAKTFEPTDEFQQVTDHDFVDRYRVQGMGYGADVFYQRDVSLIYGLRLKMQFIDTNTAREWYDELLTLDTCEPLPFSIGYTFRNADTSSGCMSWACYDTCPPY